LLKTIELPSPKGPHSSVAQLASIVTIIEYYETSIKNAGARTAKDAMAVVAQKIEADGLHGVNGLPETEPPKRSQDVLGFSRFACQDGLALMP
jgi:hypothetical protein